MVCPRPRAISEGQRGDSVSAAVPPTTAAETRRVRPQNSHTRRSIVLFFASGEGAIFGEDNNVRFRSRTRPAGPGGGLEVDCPRPRALTWGRLKVVRTLSPVLLSAWLGLSLAAVGCPSPSQLGPGFSLGDAVECGVPREGFDRLAESRVARGIDLDLPEPPPHQCSSFPGGLVAQDLDGDGDIDLAFARFDRFPALLENDGTGVFFAASRDDELGLSNQRHATSIAAVDTSGDHLPELFVTGPNLLLRARNLGGMQFGELEPLYDLPDYPWACFNSMSWGDADGDGDLDVFLPALFGVPDAEWWEADQEEGPWALGSENVLLLNDSGQFVAHGGALGPGSGPSLSFLSAFTDRDGDGDQDLLVTSDRSNLPWWPEGVFYRKAGWDKEGQPLFEIPGEDFLMPGSVSGMGMASADFNDDGLLDYCMTDFARRLACFQSEGSEGYLDISLTSGLAAALPGFPPAGSEEGDWVPWSMSMVDLDNDGRRDVAVAAGPTPGLGSVATSFQIQEQPNAIWQGVGPARFEERTAELGFGDTDADYGLVSADLDSDGYRELIVSSWSGQPKVYDNPCGSSAWLEVELVGPPGNTEGFGARLQARDGDWWHSEELHNLLGVGQEPSRFHLGLGSREVLEELEVLWPDGTRMSSRNIPTRRLLTVTHPDAS